MIFIANNYHCISLLKSFQLVVIGYNFEEKMVMKILIPTDFTYTSINAINVALDCFTHEAIELFLCSVIKVSALDSAIVNDFDIIYADFNDFDIHKTRLKNLSKKIKRERENVKVIEKLSIGFTVDELVKFENDINPDLVVIGSNKNRRFKTKLNSISANTAIRFNAPTLVIPSATKKLSLKNFVYVSDYAKEDQSAIQHLFNVFFPTLERFDCIHYGKTESLVDLENIGKFNSVFSAEIENSILNFEFFEAEENKDAIQQIIELKKPDVLVCLHNHKTFWQKIFSKSTSKDIVFKAEVPVLVYHETFFKNL